MVGLFAARPEAFADEGRTVVRPLDDGVDAVVHLPSDATVRRVVETVPTGPPTRRCPRSGGRDASTARPRTRSPSSTTG